jgi:hypothetical protein
MNPPLEALPNDSVALQEIITSLQARMSHLHGQHEHQVSILLEQIRHLRQQLFGKRSERLPVEASPVQLPLFDLPEPERIEPAKVPVEPHSRRKPGRKPLPPELPRLEVIHDLPEEEKVCACGCALSRIGEEVSEQLDIIPDPDPGAAPHPPQICLPGVRRGGGRGAGGADRADAAADHPPIHRQSWAVGPRPHRQVRRSPPVLPTGTVLCPARGGDRPGHDEQLGDSGRRGLRTLA